MMRRILLALFALAFASTAQAQNYTATQGTGTTFGSKLVSTVNYPQIVFCDPATPAQCVGVNASGQMAIQAPPTLPLPTGAATSANQTTANTSLATIATNTGGAIPAGTNRVGYTSDDPCAQLTKLGAPINLTASGQLITGTAAKKTYICAVDIVPAAAQNIALVEGTGSTCATNIYGLAGGSTAATGWNFQLGGGIARGGGVGTIYSPSADTNATAANVCLLLSGGGVQVSGHISYVQQ